MTKSGTRKISAKILLTDLMKFKSHQKYLDRDLSKFNLLMHGAQLNKLKMEQEINLPIHMKKMQYETQNFVQMVADFKERMINVAGLFNNNTKKYREEIQLIDTQLKNIESKNVSELKLLKLECCQIEESTLNDVVLVRNRSLTQFGLARSAERSASRRKVTSAPTKRSDVSYGTATLTVNWTSE